MAFYLTALWAALSRAGKALTRPGTWTAILVGCALVAVSYGTWSLFRAQSQVAELSEKLAEAEKRIAQTDANQKANEEAIQTRNELITEFAKVEAVERAETLKALEANPDWANQPIPADVLASLRN